MNSKLKYLIMAVVIMTGLGLVAKSALDDVKATAAAYLYGYPLVMMDETRKGTVADSGTNILAHSNDFPDGDFRLVVRPNFDSLYTTVWFDLSQGPQVLSMPATGERYYVLPFMDAWTNVFERRGTSTTGNIAQEIAVVGPNFNGSLPKGISSVVIAPTNMVWMIGRIQTNDSHDVANVSRIQSMMKLTPLADWRNGERHNGHSIDMNETKDTEPLATVENMDAQTFFSKLNNLMGEQYPLADDASELAKFSYLNIAPNADFDINKLGFIERWAVEQAIPLTIKKVDEAVLNTPSNEQGWKVNLDLGVYGVNYPLRAAIAKYGLGALPAVEASYPGTVKDGDGETYDGSKHSYLLHFDAGKFPPVEAFWSLTVYDFEGYMKNNEIDRFSISDRSKLQYNDDGSLDIYIQTQRPKQGISNWLPVPNEEFNMVLRMYQAQDSFLNGEWTIPAVKKVKGA